MGLRDNGPAQAPWRACWEQARHGGVERPGGGGFRALQAAEPEPLTRRVVCAVAMGARWGLAQIQSALPRRPSLSPTLEQG